MTPGADNRQPVAEEVVEDLVVAVRPEGLLDLAPVIRVEVLLLGHRKAHERVVADEFGRREVLARGVFDPMISCSKYKPKSRERYCNEIIREYKAPDSN